MIRRDHCPLLLAQAERHHCDLAPPSVVEIVRGGRAPNGLQVARNARGCGSPVATPQVALLALMLGRILHVIDVGEGPSETLGRRDM